VGNLRNAHRIETRGGTRFFPRLIRFLVFILILVGLGSAYIQGYLDPVLRNPQVVAGWKKVQGMVQPLVSDLRQKVPFLAQWFSSLPDLQDVDPGEFDQLKLANQADFTTQGPKLALALSRKDLIRPVFYTASNLPDDTSIEVLIIGRPETLLNRLHFSGVKQVSLKGGFGHTTPLVDQGGQPLPRGVYRIFAVDSSRQTPEVQLVLSQLSPLQGKIPVQIPAGRHVYALGEYFLGGRKDKSYAERLRLYHERIRKQSDTELMELRQFHATLKSQLDSTVKRFSALRRRRKISSQESKSWNRFFQTWNGLSGQLAQSFRSWTPDVLVNRHFHVRLYEMTKEAAKHIFKVHGMENDFVVGKPMEDFSNAYGEALVKAQVALAELSNSLEKVKSMPPSPVGMPQRLPRSTGDSLGGKGS